jgi:hypothetical protein
MQFDISQGTYHEQIERECLRFRQWTRKQGRAAVYPHAVTARRFTGAKNQLCARMLSAVTYLAHPGEPDAIDRLADTLSALVAGVAAGLVADAVIVADRPDEAVATVAEATGAALVLCAGRDPFAAGAAVARRDWVLCLDAGDVPADGWIRTLDRFVGTARPETGLGRLRRPGAGLGARAAARVEALVGARTARAGDVVRRETLRAGPFAPRLRVRHLIARIDRP